MRALTSLVAMLALFATHSPARADDAIQKEMAKLQGSWQLVSIEMGGVKDPNKNNANSRLIVKGDKFFLTDEDKTTGEGTFKIIEVVGKVRKTNLTFANAGLLGGGFTLAKWLDEDSFQTCFHAQKRPTGFTSTEQNGQILMTFRRVKK
jgi:uncharacterized protein (TIGR03067 family)